LTGDAAAADPVCSKSALHGEVQKIVLHGSQRPVQDKPLLYRNDANSMKFAGIPIREAREEV
jgi:pyrroloquinoline quinone biosynthesis protein E